MQVKHEEKVPSRIISNNAYMMKLAWRISPARVIFQFVDAGVDMFMWMFTAVIFMRLIVGDMEHGAGFGEIAANIGMAMILLALCGAYRTWDCYKHDTEAELHSNEKLYAMLFDKCANVELACYEDPAFYDRYTLAVGEAGKRLGNVIESISGLVVLPIVTGYVAYQLVLIDPFLLFFTLIPLVCTFVFEKAVQRLRYKQKLEDIENDRKKKYVNRVFYLAQYAKEIRLSNVAKILNRMYREGHDGTMALHRQYTKRVLPFAFLDGLFRDVFLYFGVLLYGTYRVIVSQTIGIGEFVILYGAMRYIKYMLGFISETLVNIYKNALYINNLRNFLEHKPAIPEDQPGEPVKRFSGELELRDVGFTYRGSDPKRVFSLHDINMTIRRGEKIAIVGHNGAGKSTLVKLLMRLYDPTIGEILLDGKNIKTFDLQQYRGLFSAAFQDQRLFSMSVADNVAENKERAVRALKQSGIWNRVQRMPHRENSVLTQEFDPQGVVLSGGETQKISIARAFAKDFYIGIFDEPSSALDPIAEYKLFESMMDVFKDKTVIFISHRLSSARLADRIYLFGGGAVLEEGSHIDLMRKNGLYAEMFLKQAERYIEGKHASIEEEDI